MCAPQLTSMLACWAATNDIHSTAACQEHAKALHECMRTAPMGGKQHGPTINYHLMRLNKILK
ncbi:hypothetical protein AcV7_009091 [Taiwanofungus camphoratus]|nr:hypothetical protein AcV7_009091 [Antrodia cinnamomea]